ncbi:Maf family protein [Pikeienuella sp. HZG-20]|uniref:Maf family protein n=1 Tax=Paludibacillus litoralis TaxID=3133267 RepID=UPI0030EDAA97
MTALILASGSPTRAAMLRRAGVMVEIAPARVDEAETKLSLRAAGVSPRDQADSLAEMKAVRVSTRHPGALVIGADQVLDLAGEALDKPESVAAAREDLLRLRGARHELFSAAVIALDGAPIWRHIGRARLTMRRFSEAFIDDYLASIGDDVFSTVGGYRIEETGAQLFARVEGDWFTILGLPLLELLAFLRVRGVLQE